MSLRAKRSNPVAREKTELFCRFASCNDDDKLTDNMEGYYYVYIATNCRHTVLYTGITRDIFKRAWQHKNKVCKNSFTDRYNVEKVVFYEAFTNPLDAIAREKQIKSGSRHKKLELIKGLNPCWLDLIEKSLK